MSTVCGTLSSYQHNCNFPESGGASDQLMIIPHSIIDRTQGVDGFTYNATNPLIIEQIHIKPGNQAYVFEGKRNPNSILSTPVNEGSATGFNHSVMFPLYEMSPDTANTIKYLQGQKVLALLKTNQRNSTGNNWYKIAGVTVGMYLSEGNYNSSENNGVIPVTLATGDGLMEPNALSFFFKTDIATTNAGYEALKVLVPTIP